MKRAFLIIITFLFVCSTIKCQWYSRRYGVNDINQLTREQLNEALIRAQNKITGGIVLSVAGAIGIGAGSYLIAHSKKIYPEANDITQLQLSGFSLLVVSIPIEITGLIKWALNGERAKTIRSVLKSTEMKPGFVYFENINTDSELQRSLSPCLKVTIHF